MPVITFLVNGSADSAMGDRARAFAARLQDEWEPVVLYRAGSRAGSVRVFLRALRRVRPSIVYVLDMALSGVVAAAGHRLSTGTPFVVDTGDAVTALARSDGRRGRLAIAATSAVEHLGMRLASHLVVRGSVHRDILAARGRENTFIPDGVDTGLFRPIDAAETRTRLGFGDDIVVTVLGSSVWNPRLRMAYGWDLVEALGILRGLPIRGLMIGDGSGIPFLMDRARALGVADRLVLTGRQPVHALPALLCASDVCLSTQTNDIVGQVRTTGKLPLYLGCGRFVLASDVGEASRVLPRDMLVEYRSEGRDDAYPARLALRLRDMVMNRALLTTAERCVALARTHFDYDVLAARLRQVLRAQAS